MYDTQKPLNELLAQVRDTVTYRKNRSLPYIGLEHLVSGRSSVAAKGVAEDSISTNLAFRSGDILFGKLRPNLQKSVRADFDGYCSTDVIVLRARGGLYPSYAGWIMRSSLVFAEAVRTAEGTKMPRTSWRRLQQLRVQVPPWQQQQAIAETLDNLDHLIQVGECHLNKVARLHEGLINHFLLHALNRPATPLSAVVTSAVDGPFGSNLKTEHYVEEPGVRVVRLQNIGRGQFIDDDDAYISERHAQLLHRHEVRSGDLLIASLGDERHPIARACLYPEHLEDGIVKADCFRLRLDPGRALHSYVMQVLNSAITRRDISALTQGVTRQRMNLRSLLRLKIRLPSIEEQYQLREATIIHEHLVERASREIASLRLLKQGLMDDLLTGRVRVPVGDGHRGDVVVWEARP